MIKFKNIYMVALCLFLFTFSARTQCDLPVALCQDITITLDGNGEYTLGPTEVDDGSTAACGLQSLDMDKTFFNCDDLDPILQPTGKLLYEAGEGLIANVGTIALGNNGEVYLADIDVDAILKFDSNGNLISSFGSFTSLRGIYVDETDKIYATDDIEDKIKVFDQSGTLLLSFGSSGTGVGQFTNPWRVSVSSFGIYIVDYVQNKVVVFDYNGNFLYEFGTFGTNAGDFNDPYDITHDANDNVYVLDLARRKVIKFDPFGNFIFEFGEAPSGSAQIGRLDIVVGMAVGSDGTIYIADRSSTTQNNKVMVFDSSGNFLYEFGENECGPGIFENIYSIDVGLDNNIYVSDIVRDNIMVFEQSNVGEQVTLTITDVNGDAACCKAEVTVVEGDGCVVDVDGDGFSSDDGDCDDTNVAVFPGAPEICDGIDNNCDGSVDEDGGIFPFQLIITSQAQLDTLQAYSVINGNLNIIGTDVHDLSNLSCLSEVRNGVNIYDNPNLVTLNGLESLVKAKGITLRRNASLTDISALSNVVEVGTDGIEVFDNDALETLGFLALNLLDMRVEFDPVISIGENNSLTSVDFPALDSVGGWIYIYNNHQVNSLDFASLRKVDFKLQLTNTQLPAFQGFPLLERVGNIDLNRNLLLSDLGDLQHVYVENDVFIKDAAILDVDKLTNNDKINGQLFIQSCPDLTDINRIGSLDSIGSFFRLTSNQSLTDCCPIASLIFEDRIDTLVLENNGMLCNSETEIVTNCLDTDMDGFTVDQGDCDDANPEINPGAIEKCNGVDDDCDGTIDEDLGVWVGNFIVSSQEDLDNFGSYSEVTGNLNIINTNVTDLTPLSCLEKTQQLVITGNPQLTSLAGLENLKTITGSLRIIDNDGLTQITELVSLDSVGFNTGISDNASVELIEFPSLRDAGSFVFSAEISAHPTLHTLSFPVLESASAEIRIQVCPQLTLLNFPVLTSAESILLNQLEIVDLDAFLNVSQIPGSLSISSCPNITSLSAFDNTSLGSIAISSCASLNDLGALGNNTTFQSINIRSNSALVSLSGMEDIININGDLSLWYNNSLSDCCAIAEMLNSGGVAGNINIQNNPQFCNSATEIVSTCLDQDGDGFTIGDGDCDDSNPQINPGSCGGDIFLLSQSDVNNLICCSGVWTGSITIGPSTDIVDLSPLTGITGVTFDLNIIGNENLTSLSGLDNISAVEHVTYIEGNPLLTSISAIESSGYAKIDVRNNASLVSISGFDGTNAIGDPQVWFIDNVNLTTISGFNNLSVASSLLLRDNALLDDISGLSDLTSIGNFVEVSGSKLSDFSDLANLESVASNFTINNNHSLISLNGLQQLSVASALLIQNNSSLNTLDGLQGITTFPGAISIGSNQNLSQLTGLENLISLEGISINSNPSLNDISALSNLDNVQSILDVSKNGALVSLTGLDNLQAVTGTLQVVGNTVLSDCCSIANLLDQGGVGTAVIASNPQFCGSASEIISFCLDQDGDGYTIGDGDCDDENPLVNPGMTEVCNGIDDDCNGLIDAQDPLLEDTISPEFVGSLPSDVIVDCSSIPLPETLSFTDDCGAELTFAQYADWDGECGNFTIRRDYILTDGAGNTTIHTHYISVIDTVAPQIISNLPADITVDSGSIPPPADLVAFDACGSVPQVFMEMDSLDDPNESLTLTGTLGDVQVEMALEGVTTSQYKFLLVYTDNSLPTFSNSSIFTPSASGLDGAGFNAISGDAVLRISFDTVVSNPVLHINNIDISRWDFSPTTDDVSLISGNSEIGIENATLIDQDPTTSGGSLSGSGSVLFHGTFEELVIHITLVDITTDGLFIQLSKPGDPIVDFDTANSPGACPGEEIISRSWTVSDACGNISTYSQQITVTAPDLGPEISEINIVEDPILLGSTQLSHAVFSEECDLDDHSATWDWGDGTTSVGTVNQLLNEVSGTHIYASTGVYPITLIVSDADGNADTLVSSTYAVIYNPDGGFVTGGGWIDSPAGAYVQDSSLTGKAHFGFVSKYKRGADIPTGNTQFKFNAGGFHFKSDVYEWLVVSGPNAKFKGEGSVNNQGHYGFMVTAKDAEVNGGGNSDEFRIKIWDKLNSDLVVYDNKMGESDEANVGTVLSGGSITIHSDDNAGNRSDYMYPIDFNVFPNPATNLVNIELPYGFDGWVHVRDHSGRLLRSVHSLDLQTPIMVWDAKDYASGLYFITLINDKNSTSKKLLLVK